MRLFTSSFRVRVGAFVLTLVACLALAEWYCRTSPNFASGEQFSLRNYTLLDATHAVIGDSQIGSQSRIPGYAFYGWAGMQPAELLRLVKYVYATQKPERIILEMAPQWFGEYHIGREEFITDDALPPKYFKLLVLSPYFYEDLKRTLGKDAWSLMAMITSSAWAENLERPEREFDVAIAKRWEAAAEEARVHGKPYPWSSVPADDRRDMTLSRVYSQNPRPEFTTEKAANNLTDALDLLLEMGADVCLYRPPVTAEFEHLAAAIPTSNYAKFDHWANALANSRHLKWVHYSNLPMQFTDDVFFNQDHMNEIGLHEAWPLVEKACFGKE